jgi:hypothetical protein
MDELKKYSTAQLIKELSSRADIQSFPCGLYQYYAITPKYGEKTPKLPPRYYSLVIPVDEFPKSNNHSSE